MSNRLLLVFVIIVLSLGAGTFLALQTEDEVKTAELPSVIGTPFVPPPTPTPAPTAEPLPTATPEVSAAVARIQAPSIGINAPVIALGVDSAGVMQSPSKPMDVAWYRFSAKPGQGSNVVMAGHVDYINFGAAVFYRLRDLKPGDEIKVTLDDGVSTTYRVQSLTWYDEATAPVAEIVGPTEGEMITLITCAGSFDRNTREYNQRLVVRGERV